MYGQIETKPAKHYEMAERMASEIYENFTPEEQNEILKVLVESIRKRRLDKIQELGNKLSYLQELLTQIREV